MEKGGGVWDQISEWEQCVVTDEITGKTEVDPYAVALCNQVWYGRNMIKRKAIFVADGFRRVFGVNFDEAYAPVTTMDALRLTIVLSEKLGLKICVYER